MDTEMQKEQWLNDVLQSTEGMHKAMPPDDLYERFMARLKQPEPVRTIAFPVKQWAAAAVILLALNIGSVVYFMGQTKANDHSVNPIATALEMDTTYNY